MLDRQFQITISFVSHRVSQGYSRGTLCVAPASSLVGPMDDAGQAFASRRRESGHSSGVEERTAVSRVAVRVAGGQVSAPDVGGTRRSRLSGYVQQPGDVLHFLLAGLDPALKNLNG